MDPALSSTGERCVLHGCGKSNACIHFSVNTGLPNRFRRWGQPSQGEFAAGEIRFERLEIARLDNDPSLPENGKLDFFMEGGL